MHSLLQLRAFLLLATTIIGCVFGCPKQMSVALAMPCEPGQRALIVMERVQGGFAGETSERTRIGEDGCFSIERVLNGKVIAHVRSGQLGPEQIRNGRSAISAADFKSIPHTTGTPAVVNPAFLSITYQGVTKTAALMSGTEIDGIRALAGGSPQDPATRLADLFIRLTNLTGS